MKEYFRENKKGIIGTVIFHFALLVMLFFLGYSTDLPLPGEEGILINFGYEEMGSGDVEPLKSSNKPVEEKQTPPPVSASQESVETGEAEEDILTQDIEKTVAIDSKKANKPKEKTPEEIEADKIRQQEIDKKIKDDQDRLDREEEERLERLEEERRIQEINQRFSSLGKKVDGDDGSGEGDDDTYKGNKGSEDGDVDSKVHGPGHGGGVEGVSFSLDGRTHRLLPKPIDNSQQEGTVVVEIRVNSSGDVTSAVVRTKGTNTFDEYLWKVSKEAALKAKFNEDPKSYIQTGTITYHFVLQ